MSGVRVAGHFGEWLQGRLGPAGPVVLVTLACTALGVTVTRAEGRLAVRGAGGVLSVGRLEALLSALGLPLAGRYDVASEMPPGGGAGASTAALVAAARASGGAGAGRLAAACVVAEGASDPLMLRAPGRHLWASRRGQSLRRFAAGPEAEVVGGFRGAPQRTVPADQDFPDIADLVARWGAADLAGRAALASASAERTAALRGPEDDPTGRLAVELGALGHARAHTGSARALIYAPGAVPEGVEAALAAQGYAGVIRFRTGGGR